MALHPRHQRAVRFKTDEGLGDVVLLHPADARVAIANGLAVAAPRPMPVDEAGADDGGGAADGVKKAGRKKATRKQSAGKPAGSDAAGEHDGAGEAGESGDDTKDS